MQPEEVGEVLNEYIALVFTKKEDMDDGKIKGEYVDILRHVNIKKVVMLGKIKVDKFSGPDGINLSILMEARETIAKTLTEIFVSSLARAKIPEDCRIANVVSLFKKDNR
eukprot:g43125.t1